MQEVYTLQEVAEKMKVSVQSITKIVKSGKMKSVLIGRTYRITDVFLSEYLNGIYGDKPVIQTRAVSPSEILRRVKAVTEPIIEPLPQVVTVEPAADQELGIDLFPHIEPVKPIDIIIKLRAEGKTYQEIAEYLNSLGIKTAKGKEWTKASIDNNIREHKKSLPQ